MARMKVVGGTLNIRKEPSLGAELVGQLAEGTVITVGTEKDGWYEFNGRYVMAIWLEPAEPAEDPEPQKPTAPSDAEEIKAAAKELKAAAKEMNAAVRKATKKKAANK